MKKIVSLIVFAMLLFAGVGELGAGVVGDVNNDGVIGLPDVIYGLQVVAGLRPESPTAPLIWQGGWQENVFYQQNKVVQFNEVLYVCVQSHTSSVSNAPPSKVMWSTLASIGQNFSR